MTSYNERLGEILANLANQIAANEQRLLNGNATREETIDSDSNATMRAKQAITSLIKELVAEVKPINKQGEIDIDEPAHNDGYWSGAYNTLEKFEQNLLNVLEEV